MKKYFSWAILILFTYSLIEAGAYGGLHWLKNSDLIRFYHSKSVSEQHAKILKKFIAGQFQYKKYNPTLGWTIKPDGTTKLYQANSLGFRGSREYSIQPIKGKHRISTFGDSFTHGNDVNNEETWQTYMEGLDSNREVLNLGVGGYGLDQAYLRYLQDGRQYQADIVFIGFMSENIFRNVNTFRPFYYPNTKLPLAKPRFEVKGDKLRLIPNQMQSLQDYENLLQNPQETLSKLGAKDFYYRKNIMPDFLDWSPSAKLINLFMQRVSYQLSKKKIVANNLYSETSEAFIVTKLIFDKFYNAVINDKATPLIIIFPNSQDVQNFQNGKRTKYSPLLKYLQAKGYDYIDLMDAFATADENKLFSGHYTPYGNKLVADHIHEVITKIQN
jgi:hypothetical protein